jgi:hypothetical protein
VAGRKGTFEGGIYGYGYGKQNRTNLSAGGQTLYSAKLDAIRTRNGAVILTAVYAVRALSVRHGWNCAETCVSIGQIPES